MYLLKEGNNKKKLRAQLLGGGTILREVIAAAELLDQDFNVACDIWSITSAVAETAGGLRPCRPVVAPEGAAAASLAARAGV